MNIFQANLKSGFPKYKQLAEHIITLIRNKQIAVGYKMPTVNRAYDMAHVSRDTIINTYKYLQEEGWVNSVPGKGFFVVRNTPKSGKSLFMLFDAMNPYKETLYRSLTETLGGAFRCYTSFHYYDKNLFEKLIEEAVGKHDYYVIIPHFNTDITPVLRKIPARQLLLLDGFPHKFDLPCSAVYQDFMNDLYEELKSLQGRLEQYECLHIVYNGKFQFMPGDILAGIHLFVGETGYPVHIHKEFDVEDIQKGHCYMAVSERDLACIIKVINDRGWKLKEDIGLMSFDDTPLKEVLQGGITTLSTDFEGMGRTAGQLILSEEVRKIANPWVLKDRGSM